MSRQAGIHWARRRATLDVLADIAAAGDSPGRVCELIRSNLSESSDQYDVEGIAAVVDIARAIDHSLIKAISQ